MFLLSINYGAGRHFLLLTVGEFETYLKLFYVLNINLNLAATFIKLSLLFQFLRIFDKGTKAYGASIVGIVLVALWGLTFTVLSICPCADISDAWNILAGEAHCWGYASQNSDIFMATLVSHNLINTLSDVYITAIPFQLVITLSAWRVSETIYYKAGWYPTQDPTWYGPMSIMLMVLEIRFEGPKDGAEPG